MEHFSFSKGRSWRKREPRESHAISTCCLEAICACPSPSPPERRSAEGPWNTRRIRQIEPRRGGRVDVRENGTSPRTAASPVTVTSYGRAMSQRGNSDRFSEHRIALFMFVRVFSATVKKTPMPCGSV